MISAVQQEEAQRRQRAKSVASGPAFSVPELPGLADLQALSLPAAPACTIAPAVSASAPNAPSANLDLSGFFGRSVGSGQCVALVRAANPDLGPSSTWSAGSSVQGNAGLQPGTPIATFEGSRYANALDGSSHAAIYLGQNATGVTVLDQWAGKAAAVRTIPWTNPGAAAANTGSAFRVVKPA